MSVRNSILAIPLTTFNSAALNPAVYQAINANGLDEPCIIIRINNAGTTGVTISYDGVNDHELLPTGQVLQLEAQTNAVGNLCNFRQGTVVYIRGVAGVGSISLSGYYQPQGA